MFERKISRHLCILTALPLLVDPMLIFTNLKESFCWSNSLDFDISLDTLIATSITTATKNDNILVHTCRVYGGKSELGFNIF